MRFTCAKLYRAAMACLFTLLLAVTAVGEDAKQIAIAQFSSGDLNGWQPRAFKGKTRYQLDFDDNRQALHAVSLASASGLYRKVTIELRDTPCLNWSWKVDKLVGSNLNERSKGGDDYPARVYVVFSGGLQFWRTRAINYVWSNNQPVDSHWPNAYTANAQMVAVQSGAAKLDHWLGESRNVLEDYRRIFGDEPGKVVAVALMSDTDNSRLSASAWYGDIQFSTSQAGQCAAPS